MIDLSFLTEGEQETILAVLKRDAELKKAEEQRVQNLQQSVADLSQLRCMTGEWFYETKQRRHQDRIHGSDIIIASMKHTHKPLTILELSQIAPVKSSFVSSENKDVFVPPVLRGVLQEPHMQLSNDEYEKQYPYETPLDTPKLPATKQRKNPFNSEVAEGYAFEEKDSQLLDRAVDHTQTPKEESLLSSDSCTWYARDLTQDPNNRTVSQNASAAMPMPPNTVDSTISEDCFVEVDDRQTNSVAPRGILKQLSSSSTSDFLFSRPDPQSPVSLDSPTETWIDRKQVRFSSSVSQSGLEWHDGKERGEYSLLDAHSITPSEVENNNDLENTVSTPVGTYNPEFNWSQEDSKEGELNCKNEMYLQEKDAGQHQVLCDVSEDCYSEFLSSVVSGLVFAEQGSGKPVDLEPEPEEDQVKATDWQTAYRIHHQKLPELSSEISLDVTSDTKPSTNGSSKGSSQAISPKPRQRLLGLFRREKDKTDDVQEPQKEEVKIFMQKEPGCTQNPFHCAVDTTVYKPSSVKQETKPSEMKEVRTLQLTALQNTPFKETVSSADEYTQQKATEGRLVQLPDRLSDLKAFWERENSGPKIIFTREARQKEITKTGIETSPAHQTDSGEQSTNNNLSPQTEMIVDDTADTPQEKSLPPLSAVLFKGDGTYRANPVLIYEETDDSLTVTETQISEPQEQIISAVPSCDTSNTQKQEGAVPLLFPRLSHEDRLAKTNDLKHFLEKEQTGPRVISAGVKETPRSSTLSNEGLPLQSDLRTCLDSREKSEENVQTSPNKTVSNVVLKPKVTDSPNRSQLMSSGSAGDVQPALPRYHVKDETDAQERPLSPSKTSNQRSKEQGDEVKRSPSKTCHPRALPRESSSPTGSPLKTFPIDINPQTKVIGVHQAKPTPVPRQRKVVSCEATQTVPNTNPTTEIPSRPLPSHLDGRGTYFDNADTPRSRSSSSTSPQFKKASDKKSETFPGLARSVIPQDYQHYLGPQEKAYLPPFQQEKAAAAESDTVHRPQNALRGFVGNQCERPTQGYENCSPVMLALKRLSSKSMSSSKSLENLTSQTSDREERSQDNSREQMNQSVEDVSSPSASGLTLSNSKQKKISVSVPFLQQDETDTSSTLGLRRNTGSSMSNLSLSSGMASMSSVSGSISSIYTGDFGDVEVQGSIQFAVNYIQKLGEFHIFVVHCRDLAVADIKKSRSDPYVKCYLLPDKTKLGKRKSTVKKKSINPTYNEILRFKITLEVLKTQNLNISVWHNDTFGRNSFLGEVDLDLSEWDFNNTEINEYALKARASANTSTSSPSCLMDNRGQMRVALRFLPQTSLSQRKSKMETGEVQIWVKDCKSLPPVRGVIIDPFVKCTVLPDTSRKSRQKTRVVKRTANPMFNHTMVYDGFRPDDLREACVEITVWDHDRLNNHFIGGLRIGMGTGKSYGVDVLWMDSTTNEANLWQRMLQADGEWVEDVLPLRMLVMAKSMSK